MTLRDKSFEKSAGRKIRRIVKESPALQKEYRRVRKVSRRDTSQPVLRALMSLALGVSLGKMATTGAAVDGLLALLTVWCTCFTIHYANRLRFQLYIAPQILVLALQPVRDAVIFAHQWREFVKTTLWLLLDAVGAFGVIFWMSGAGTVQWLTAIPCALALWMAALSVSAAFVWIRPAANYGGVSSALFIFMMAIVLAAFYGPEAAGRVLNSASGALYFLPPFGWINYVTREAVLGSGLLSLILLLPVALLAPALHHAKRRLAANYQIFASDAPEAPDHDDDLSHEQPDTPEPSSNADRPKADPELVAKVTEAWKESSLTPAKDGIVERLVTRWLTPRERDLAEFMTAGNVDWTAQLRRSAILTLAALFAGITLGPAGIWICYIGLYFALSTSLPLLGTPCVGFATVNMAGAAFPAYAGLPVGYREVSRLLIKVGVVRTLSFVPIALPAGAIVGHLAEASWTLGLWTSVKVMVLLLGWQPLIVAFQFSAGTNDTRGFSRRAFKFLLLFGPIVLALVGLSVGSLLAPPIAAAGCVIVAAFLAWSAYRLYGRFYHRNAFDLMHGESQ